MIKNLKYRFASVFTGCKIRACCAVALAVITLAAAYLLDISVNTVKVFDGEKTSVARPLSPNTASVLNKLELKSENYNVVSTATDENSTFINIEYTFPFFTRILYTFFA